MAVADGFHVDSIGNLWLGSNRETFDATTRSEAPFYVYANGDLVANSGTFSGNLSAAGGTFSGDLSAAGGTFTGNLSAAGGTFSGDLSAAGGTFTGTLSGVDGTFTGTISANNVTGGTLDFDSVTASNLDFTSLSVQAGDIVAQIATDEILGKISNGAISEAKLGSISATKISAGTLTGFNISGGTINIGNAIAADNSGVTMTQTVNISPTGGSIGNGNVSISGSSLFATGTVRSNSYHSATRYYDINSSSNMDLASSFVYLKPGDAFGLNVSTSTSTIYSTFQPSNDGGKNLGTSSRRWSTVYRISESSTSDERLKENIIDINYGLDFINNLRPREFTWKSWSNGFACNICGQIYDELQDCTSQIKSVDENDEEILIDCTGNVIEQFTEADDKYTFGFIAQELLPNLGTEKEYNLLNHNTEVDEYNYSQENLIAPLVKAVQELSAKNDELQSRIEELEG
jgi:hypothetical protein